MFVLAQLRDDERDMVSKRKKKIHSQLGSLNLDFDGEGRIRIADGYFETSIIISFALEEK